ncbi:hypothetical protein JTB14_015949 [Gonioctena quinquepunctata]|nr:hypothetical protein JTB14_015949 [Gonioctena quinquepunctata]
MKRCVMVSVCLYCPNTLHCVLRELFSCRRGFSCGILSFHFAIYDLKSFTKFSNASNSYRSSYRLACPEDFDQDHGLVLLLSFTNIKLAGALVEYRFFSVVIDHLDEVANKLVIKKLHGDFNIGLSRMHFYSHPNQKLQWTMLNWSNPGCVGKLDEFYQNDNDNFANLRDNYHHWWFTLTWKFCDSFQKQTDSEIKSYSEILSKWASENNLIIIKKGWTDQKKIRKSVTKTNDHLQHTSKSIPDIDDDAADINVDLGKRPKKDNFDSIHLEESSSDTVIYEQKFLEVKTDESHISKPVEDEIILSLIDGKDQATPVAGDDPKIEVTHKKEELMSEIFDDNFSHTESQWHPEDDDDNFLLSLI